jgi:hypothetical protein
MSLMDYRSSSHNIFFILPKEQNTPVKTEEE